MVVGWLVGGGGTFTFRSWGPHDNIRDISLDTLTESQCDVIVTSM